MFISFKFYYWSNLNLVYLAILVLWRSFIEYITKEVLEDNGSVSNKRCFIDVDQRNKNNKTYVEPHVQFLDT